MLGWRVEEVERYVMMNGYWFIICASIDSAWMICDEKLLSGELEIENEDFEQP